MIQRLRNTRFPHCAQLWSGRKVRDRMIDASPPPFKSVAASPPSCPDPVVAEAKDARLRR